MPLSTATCTFPRKHFSGFAVAGVIVRFLCSKRTVSLYLWDTEKCLDGPETGGKSDACLCHGAVCPARGSLISPAASSHLCHVSKSQTTTAPQQNIPQAKRDPLQFTFPQSSHFEEIVKDFEMYLYVN